MSLWYLFYFLLLLVLGVCVFITSDKVKKEVYNPYFLKPVIVFFGSMGALFLIVSFVFLIRL